MSAKSPNLIDRHVGSRMRIQRMLIGMSQEKLGEALGITVQQIQKYEKGINRIGASRLHKLAGILGVSITYFFEAHDGSGAIPADRHEGPDPSLFADRETIELAMAFSRIENPEVRRALLDLARAAASVGPEAARED
jgi:transcriptional regulator with XRE-family HTH domain